MSLCAATSKVPLVAAQLSARSSQSSLASAKVTAAQHLSTQATVAIENLQDVLEEYRQVHYRQCLPSRFKKDLVKVIASDGIETLLRNIGAEDRIPRSDIQTILSEAGSPDGQTIPANRMIHLI